MQYNTYQLVENHPDAIRRSGVKQRRVLTNVFLASYLNNSQYRLQQWCRGCAFEFLNKGGNKAYIKRLQGYLLIRYVTDFCQLELPEKIGLRYPKLVRQAATNPKVPAATGL